jgi:hypothetical protein
MVNGESQIITKSAVAGVIIDGLKKSRHSGGSVRPTVGLSGIFLLQRVTKKQPIPDKPE